MADRHIYFIQPLTGGPIKIGTPTDGRRRRRAAADAKYIGPVKKQPARMPNLAPGIDPSRLIGGR